MSQRYVPLGEMVKLAVETVPAWGCNDEVLRAHRLDPTSVAAAVREAVDGRS